MSQNEEPIVDKFAGDVIAALNVFDPDMAEQIIGSDPPEEYGILIQGTRAVHTMMWGALRQHGLRDTQSSLRAGAQALVMLLQIVNYAFAAGVRHGRATK